MVSHVTLLPLCGRVECEKGAVLAAKRGHQTQPVYRMILSTTSASTWKVHVKDHDGDDDDDDDDGNDGNDGGDDG